MKEMIYKNAELNVVLQLIFSGRGSYDYRGLTVSRNDKDYVRWGIACDSRPFQQRDWEFPYPFEGEELQDYRNRVRSWWANGIAFETRCTPEAADDVAGVISNNLSNVIERRHSDNIGE